MEISAEIVKGISYQPLLQKQLKQISYGDFDVNQIPASCLVSDNQNSFAANGVRQNERAHILMKEFTTRFLPQNESQSFRS